MTSVRIEWFLLWSQAMKHGQLTEVKVDLAANERVIGAQIETDPDSGSVRLAVFIACTVPS